MIWMEENDEYNVNLFTHGEIKKSNIISAYRDLTTAYGGIRDIVRIMDGIFEGCYSLTEVTIAGIIITNSVEGYLMKAGKYWKKGKYIKINGSDMFFSNMEDEILHEYELEGCSFETKESGKCFKLGK